MIESTPVLPYLLIVFLKFGLFILNQYLITKVEICTDIGNVPRSASTARLVGVDP